MNIRRFFYSVAAVFAVVHVGQIVVNHILMVSYIQSTPQLWRGPEDFSYWNLYTFQILLSVAFVYTYVTHYKARGVVNAEGFGLYTGIIIGLFYFYAYVIVPISFTLACGFIISHIVMMVVSGLLVSMIYDD